MTETEIEKFKKDHKLICNVRVAIENTKGYLIKLIALDRRGSHQSAILRSRRKLNKLGFDFERALQGIHYERWKETGAKISQLNGQKKLAVKRIDKIQKEMDALQFNIPVKYTLQLKRS